MKKLMIGATIFTSLLVASTAFAQAPLPPRGESSEAVEVNGRVMVRPAGMFGVTASSTLRARMMERGEIEKKRLGNATSTAALYKLRQEQGEKPRPMMPQFSGNGQPVVGGTVTAVSGSNITLTNKSNVTYTVSAGSAVVKKVGVASSTAASIKIGDVLIVQGAVNGSTITASSIIDQGVPRLASTTREKMRENSTTTPRRGSIGGIVGGVMGGIGNFFRSMFGFF